MRTVYVSSEHKEGYEHLVDGIRLARDVEQAATRLEQEGYEVISVVPVIGGRWNYQKYDARTEGVFKRPTVSPDTCASWGYSMTDGMMIVARRRGG